MSIRVTATMLAVAFVISTVAVSIGWLAIDFVSVWRRAEAGVGSAQVDLAFINETIRNYSGATLWYRRAAEQGNAYGQFDLGNLYQRGEGVEPNPATAAFWYEKAANQGYALAEVNLATSYYSGKGVQQNYKEAARWYEKAGESGNSSAQTFLGFLYHFGVGVPKDDLQSFMWFSLAAAQGQQRAVRGLQSLAQFMPPDQIAEAKRRAREWRPRNPEIPNKKAPANASDNALGSGTGDVAGAAKDTSSR